MERQIELVRERFKSFSKEGRLFKSSVPGHVIWGTYLSGFESPGIFRDPESNEYNCNACHMFFSRYGGIVSLSEDFKIRTLFDCYDEVPDEYKRSFRLLSDLLRGSAIESAFIEDSENVVDSKKTGFVYLGIPENKKVYTKEEAEKFGVVKPGVSYTFPHYHVDCPKHLINYGSQSKASLIADSKVSQEQLYRGLEEIKVETLELVVELIGIGSLLDGNTHLGKVEKFLGLAREYKNVPLGSRENWCWLKSGEVGYLCRFRGELIGALCLDLQTVGMEKAVLEWNKRVDPANYMKAVSPITQRQVDEAMKFAQENGYEESFVRRCATMEDIKVSDILHSNIDIKKKVSVFDVLRPSSGGSKVDFGNLPEITIDDFMSNVLPGSKDVEIWLKSDHSGNLVTLTAPVSENSKPIFKWSNNFGWTYNGGLAGKSQIRQAVSKAGGFVDAPFRFSILWNDEDTPGIVDFDAHCYDPCGSKIYYGSKRGRSGGELDIDMIRPSGVGVENIFWKSSRWVDGVYEFKVHNYDGGKNSGVKAELYIAGDTYTYWLRKDVRGLVKIASVTLKDGKVTKINHHESPVSSLSQNLWGLDTEKFHRVSLVCLSPNHWSDSVGNKHFFFMIPGCKSPDKIRGFHNENLKSDLLKHRKVLEVLGAKLLVESTPDQLSGLGFNSTVRDSVVIKVDNKVMKVKF